MREGLGGCGGGPGGGVGGGQPPEASCLNPPPNRELSQTPMQPSPTAKLPQPQRLSGVTLPRYKHDGMLQENSLTSRPQDSCFAMF